MALEPRWTVWIRATVLTLGAVIFLFPFVWMVSTSLTSSAELFAVPPKLIPDPVDISGYEQLLTREPLLRWVLNSFAVAIVVTILQVVTSAMAAYAFTRFEFPGRDIIFIAFLATMMVPFQVMVVPLFVEMRGLGLLNSYAGLIIPEIASPFGVFLLRQAFLQLPREIEEAAFVDGAGHLRVFTQVVLPMAKPMLATVAVFAFMGSWNSFLWPLVLINSPELMTLPLGLSSLTGRFVTDWNVLLAGATVAVIPIVAVYLFAQRYVLQGVAMSGLKG